MSPVMSSIGTRAAWCTIGCSLLIVSSDMVYYLAALMRNWETSHNILTELTLCIIVLSLVAVYCVLLLCDMYFRSILGIMQCLGLNIAGAL